MTALDEVLRECATAPEDDAPRLVYADLVGGERGELIVLQCDLARGGLTIAERVQRRERQQQLLDRHGAQWAGTLRQHASAWAFRRGFVEAAALERLDGAWLDEHPLLSSITIDLDQLAAIPRALLTRLRGLGVTHRAAPARAPWQQLEALARSGALAQLRAFGVEHLDDAGTAAVCAVLAAAPLEQLWLSRHALERVGPLLAAARCVRALALDGYRMAPLADDELARLAALPLAALRIDRVTARELLALSALPRLARFGIGSFGMTADSFALLGDPARPEKLAVFAEAGARFTALRTLEIGHDSALPLAMAVRPLEELRLRCRAEPPEIERIVERHRERLALLDARTEQVTVPALLGASGQVLAGVPPGMTRELLDTELLHADPAAMFERDTVGLQVLAAGAWLVRVDGDEPELWSANAPRIRIGRSANNEIRLAGSDRLARTHALIARVDDEHYTIADQMTQNGTFVGGHVITTRPRPLGDGDELVLGDVLLRWFVGDGAHGRAIATLEEARRIEPNTRLPRGTLPVRLRMANWDELWARPGAQPGRILRELARQLVAELRDGERLVYMTQSSLGVSSLATADRIAGPRTIALATPFVVELVVDRS